MNLFSKTLRDTASKLAKNHVSKLFKARLKPYNPTLVFFTVKQSHKQVEMISVKYVIWGNLQKENYECYCISYCFVKRARSVKVIVVLLGNPFQMYLNSLSFIVHYSVSVLYDDKFYCQ